MIGHALEKTEVNYQRAVTRTLEKPTGVTEKLYFFFFYIGAQQ